MEAKVYNKNGQESGTLSLSDKVFGFSWNPRLVKQVFLSESASKRKSYAHTKDRSEVSGGGRKPWQQKGTGRARHGSIRSPIWIGGGIAHGPRSERDYTEKINKKARRKALLTVLSQKLRDNEILFLEDLKVSQAKTKEGKKILESLPVSGGSSKLIIFPERDTQAWRAFRNIENVDLTEVRNLNTSEILSHKYLIMAKNSGGLLEKTFLRE